MGICGSKEETPNLSKSSKPVSTKNKKNSESPLSSSGDSSRPDSGSSSTEKEPIEKPTGNLTTKSQLPPVAEKKEPKNKMTIQPRQQAKVLLLGAGESGKSTILKQIKIIHNNGFTERERIDYKPWIYSNIIEAAKSVIKGLQQNGLIEQLVDVTSAEIETVLDYEIVLDDIDETEVVFDSNVADIIERLINDKATVGLLSNPKIDFYLLDSAKYFFSNLKKFFKDDYIPDLTDILRTRKQTSGIFDAKFQLDDLDIHLFDVGGQRSERKKWIHCFDNVTAIMFCVALSEYDQSLLESSDKNRLEESFNLFESVVNSMWFRRTSIILCLNKIDIFIEKIANSPLENHFPDYVGGSDVNKAVKYILWRFKQLNRGNLNLVPYVTQATDTNNIKLAFTVVKETIIHNNLIDSGIISA
ncbi:guanine nucleotide-binding protein subunit alpha [Martiniozyma asiatica (nom. inval.)]|nr:guanine nucleotide-binding protein subunit alpha [Martiniozyma asiatica]